MRVAYFSRAKNRYVNRALLSAAVSLFILAAMIAAVENMKAWGVNAILVILASLFLSPIAVLATIAYAWLAAWFHSLDKLCRVDCEEAIEAFRSQYHFYKIIRLFLG